MPLYEYVCEDDGTILELLRSMSDADKPVDDPDNRGRRFVRKQSAFQAQSSSDRSLPTMPMCGRCGDVPGSCRRS